MEARQILAHRGAPRRLRTGARGARGGSRAQDGDDLGLPELETFREAQPPPTRHRARFYSARSSRKRCWISIATISPRKRCAPWAWRCRNSAYAWQTRAMLLSAVGRGSPAAIHALASGDPVSSSIGWDEVWFLYLAGEQDRARAPLSIAKNHATRHPTTHGALIEHEAMRGGVRVLAATSAAARCAASGCARNRNAGEGGATSEAYREMLRQVPSAPNHQEAAVVLAIWQRLAGDERTSAATLAATPTDRRNWLTLWVGQMPVFEYCECRLRLTGSGVSDRVPAIGALQVGHPIEGHEPRAPTADQQLGRSRVAHLQIQLHRHLRRRAHRACNGARDHSARGDDQRLSIPRRSASAEHRPIDVFG